MTYILTLQRAGAGNYRTTRVRGTRAQAVNLAESFARREPNLTIRVYRFVAARNIERLVAIFSGRVRT